MHVQTNTCHARQALSSQVRQSMPEHSLRPRCLAQNWFWTSQWPLHISGLDGHGTAQFCLQRPLALSDLRGSYACAPPTMPCKPLANPQRKAHCRNRQAGKRNHYQHVPGRLHALRTPHTHISTFAMHPATSCLQIALALCHVRPRCLNAVPAMCKGLCSSISDCLIAAFQTVW
jgi:hypothetical protein